MVATASKTRSSQCDLSASRTGTVSSAFSTGGRPYITVVWSLILVVLVSFASTDVAGRGQSATANRDLLDVIVFYADAPSDVGRFPSEVREELKRYLQRVRDYRPRVRPPRLGSEMTMVYSAREGYEAKLVAAAATSDVERLAQEYVDKLQPCYEWEGFHDCPEREAVFAEQYLAGHPATPFAEVLRLLVAHRWLCAAEAFEYEQQPANAARARGAYQQAIEQATHSESRLMRAAAEELKASDRCFASDPFRRNRGVPTMSETARRRTPAPSTKHSRMRK
jgi:hypothetical protein